MAKKTKNDEPGDGIQYNMTQAAQMLGVDRGTVRNMTEDGRIEAGKTESGRYYYTAEAILAAKQKMANPFGGLTEYDVVHDVEFEAFVAKVNRKMQEGWDLAGGVATCLLTNGLYYAQAITRKKLL